MASVYLSSSQAVNQPQPASRLACLYFCSIRQNRFHEFVIVFSLVFCRRSEKNNRRSSTFLNHAFRAATGHFILPPPSVGWQNWGQSEGVEDGFSNLQSLAKEAPDRIPHATAFNVSDVIWDFLMPVLAKWETYFVKGKRWRQNRKCIKLYSALLTKDSNNHQISLNKNWLWKTGYKMSHRRKAYWLSLLETPIRNQEIAYDLQWWSACTHQRSLTGSKHPLGFKILNGKYNSPTLLITVILVPEIYSFLVTYYTFVQHDLHFPH